MMITDNSLAPPPPMYTQQPEAGHSSAPPSPTGFKAPLPEHDSARMPMPSPGQPAGSYTQGPPAAQPYPQAQPYSPAQAIPLERKTTVQQGEEYRSHRAFLLCSNNILIH